MDKDTFENTLEAARRTNERYWYYIVGLAFSITSLDVHTILGRPPEAKVPEALALAAILLSGIVGIFAIKRLPMGYLNVLDVQKALEGKSEDGGYMSVADFEKSQKRLKSFVTWLFVIGIVVLGFIKVNI